MVLQELEATPGMKQEMRGFVCREHLHCLPCHNKESTLEVGDPGEGGRVPIKCSLAC